MEPEASLSCSTGAPPMWQGIFVLLNGKRSAEIRATCTEEVQWVNASQFNCHLVSSTSERSSQEGACLSWTYSALLMNIKRMRSYLMLRNDKNYNSQIHLRVLWCSISSLWPYGGETSRNSWNGTDRCYLHKIRGCIQKLSDWPPGARTANGTVLCH
jgi:hypothetical protein